MALKTQKYKKFETENEVKKETVTQPKKEFEEPNLFKKVNNYFQKNRFVAVVIVILVLFSVGLG